MRTRKLTPPAARLPFQGTTSILEEVSQQLLEAILDGTYGPGSRLPAERELAQQLGTSRVVVREALRRLQEWQILQTRRGSGATVLPRRSWTGMALWAALTHAIASDDLRTGLALIEDALALRRALLEELIERAAGPLAGQSLAAPRNAVRDAWAQRDDPVAFLTADREIIPWLLEKAGMFASLWTLNSLGDAYLRAMGVVAAQFVVPESYPGAMQRMLDELERGEGPAARRTLRLFLDDLDRSVRSGLPPKVRQGPRG